LLKRGDEGDLGFARLAVAAPAEARNGGEVDWTVGGFDQTGDGQ
jgi:hypothetical protein